VTFSPTPPKIAVRDVWKSFRLPHQRETSIKSRVINLARTQHSVEQRPVLKGVSFEVLQGEFFGIVGRNGCGKSTMLKILAGIYYADRGHVGVNGDVTPFIELGVGFSPELTGRENIFLNGALLGFDQNEVAAMYGDIVEFAELETFMDLKLKNYSSGMQVRLAFAIAVRTDPDILLIDEVLAVGDASFQQKCLNYFYELKRSNRTIVFVSHDMEVVQRYCDRAIYIDQGIIRHEGSPSEVVSRYLLDVFEQSSPSSDQGREGSADPSHPARLLHCTVSPHEVVSTGELRLEFTYEIIRPTNLELRFTVVRDGSDIAAASTRGTPLDSRPGKYRAEFIMRLRPFLDGMHVVSGGVFHAGNGEPFDLHPKLGEFYVRDSDVARAGLVRIDGEWSALATEAH
jgi:ABC-2 type transport system ATP-binding protein